MHQCRKQPGLFWALASGTMALRRLSATFASGRTTAKFLHNNGPPTQPATATVEAIEKHTVPNTELEQMFSKLEATVKRHVITVAWMRLLGMATVVGTSSFCGWSLQPVKAS